MLLKERESFLEQLRKDFDKVSGGEGHTVFVSGEAGIGKTSLVRAFGQEIKKECLFLQGSCDALFTPRPLAPVQDVWSQLTGEVDDPGDTSDRSRFFSRFLREVERQTRPVVMLFEDVHWADEASIDFIKFFARRISRLRCLFILTFRDNETDDSHPLSAVPGQLSPDSFGRLRLVPLSREIVYALSLEKGFDGKEVFAISCGNPFYVNEILASYSEGVPEKVKDSILSVFARQDIPTREAWKLLSVLPQGLPVAYRDNLVMDEREAIEKSLSSEILSISDEKILFKHELYRRTIELSLSPLLRISLNKKMLGMLLEYAPSGPVAEQIIHFAKNANEGEIVVAYAPEAAKKAAALGAHVEASRLYMSAIEYYSDGDPKTLIGFYEGYAYECYLTNRVTEAIIYTGKAYAIWTTTTDTVATGNSLRFLSRLWWYAGNQQKAERYGLEAIEVFKDLPTSTEKAMAFSNMSQLKMLADDLPGCLQWGMPAIEMARTIGDNSSLSHALNNVGTIIMLAGGRKQEGEKILRESLRLARELGFPEHAARAYTNLGCNALNLKDYTGSLEVLYEGIRFCEERDLNSWAVYMISLKSRLFLETGRYQEALAVTGQLLENRFQAPVAKIIALLSRATVLIRTGDPECLVPLLEGVAMAWQAREPQRTIPALAALLEYEWLYEKRAVSEERLDELLAIARGPQDLRQDELNFWLKLTGRTLGLYRSDFAGYQLDSVTEIGEAAAEWARSGNTYQQALCLFLGSGEEKKTALGLVLGLGATPAAEKMKKEMRAAGIKNIPRGIRKSTRENPSQLTSREIELLPLLREGLQNKEIASRLFISPKTVDHHISSIYFKLDVKTRAGAVKEALRLDIIK